MYEVELLGDNRDMPTAATEFLKWVVSATTVLTMWLLFVYYADLLTIGKAKNIYEQVETLLSTQLATPMLIEMLVIAVHPIPTVHTFLEVKMEHTATGDSDGIHRYSLDGLLSIFVISRVYLLYRAIHYAVGDEISSDARMLATLNHVEMGPFFTFKYLMNAHAFKLIGFLVVVLTTTCAYGQSYLC